MIPYGRQNINEEDIESVVNVLKSDFLTQGPITPKFENHIAKYCGVTHALAVVNATAALHISCLALEVGPGDIVWTSPISFVASANCAIYCGATIDFVDIDSRTYNMSVEFLEEKLIEAKKIGKLPKVVIPVHLAGQSCDMEKIKTLSNEYGFKIIEDASHAIGGSYKNEKIGNCKYSDITVFSFHPVKIITTCEGGVCTTNDQNIYNKLYKLRSHGIVRNQNELEFKSDGLWYYEQVELGYNFRLNDLQAALGINQLKRIDKFVEERNNLANRYNELLRDKKDLIIPYQDQKTLSSFHLYVIRVKQNEGQDRKTLFEKFRNSGIFVNVHYIPIYRHPYYKKMFNEDDFPNAEKYYSEAISLPIFPGLSNIQMDEIIKIIDTPANFQNIF